MKLSEAIRLGSMLRPQATGHWFIANASCAMGAAAEASGMPYNQAVDLDARRSHVARMLPWLLQRDGLHCPKCGRFESLENGYLLTHLNDFHNWTREQIADWVATVEPQDDPAQAVERAESCAAVPVRVDG